MTGLRAENRVFLSYIFDVYIKGVTKMFVQANKKYRADGLTLLGYVQNGAVKTAFFDPQYRGVLDKLNYGNEGKSRGAARCGLPQMNEDTIIDFIRELDRVTVQSGHLFLWLDKFHLCTGIDKWIKNTDFNVVDLIVWDKGRMGMGYRSRRRSEYLLVLQKEPVRAKGCWNDHGIPDVWLEKTKKTHPHSKPIELQRRLIEATTAENDVVLDPAAGGFSVYEACRSSNRMFIGCDLVSGDCEFVEQKKGKLAA